MKKQKTKDELFDDIFFQISVRGLLYSDISANMPSRSRKRLEKLIKEVYDRFYKPLPEMP